jgi:phosphatidylinositol alpha-1,6-mannosyltransferase
MVCRALIESGYCVDVVSLLDRDEGAAEAKATYPTLRYFPCVGNRKVFVHRALRALWMRPDVVLVGHPNFAPLGWLLGRISRAKVVNFIYGIDAWEPLGGTRRRALSAAAIIVSISHFTASRSAQVNGIALNKVRILHNCLDPHFAHGFPSEANSRALSLLTVARINLSESYKGHNIVIRALPTLLRRFPDLIYDIVGDGDGRPVLEALAREQGVSESVRFHGVVSEKQLIECYHHASVFVMPSRFEGFGFVFLEAMAYSKAVVCGNEDASVEVVSNGETGFTINALSVEEVGDAVAKLLEDSELRDQMGEAARRLVEEKFGFAAFKGQLLDFLAEVRGPKAH